MAIPILILGESGAGKTTSLRNLSPERTLVIQSVKKALPFRAQQWHQVSKEHRNGSTISTDDYQRIHKIFHGAPKQGKDIIIVDDANYLMTNEELRRSEQTGFSKFTNMAKSFWQLIDHAQKMPGNERVYFIMHTQKDADGFIKPKTTGKMLDEKVCIEGLFTIVLRAQALDGRHFFTTKTNGQDPVKTPIDLFDNDEIDNDLNLVDNAIIEYYNL